MSCGQIALNRAGIKYNTYYASEIDKYAIKVTQANYPNTVQLGDITQITGASLPKIDLLIGGSPCQGFSIMGKQAQFDDPRSKLFWEYVRLLKETMPRYFLLENVPMKKESLQVITNALGVEPIMINSALVSAQRRKRWYWTNIPNVTQPTDKGILLQDILDNAYNNISRYRVSPARIDLIHHGRWVSQKLNNVAGKSQVLIAAYGMGGIKPILFCDVLKAIRAFTPVECERLQTVPENYTAHVSDSQRYKMLGNGWTVDVIAHILEAL